mgnify:FL=1|tara:strand:- start:136 stop:297 length:162 start_codon:yes stop_codon:yes gene_type:complete
MSKYKVVGNHKVAGVEPGGSLTEKDLEDYAVDALVEGGHLADTTGPKSTKTEE